MKRKIAFAALAATVMISCTEQKIVEPAGTTATGDILVAMNFDKNGTQISDSTHEAVAIVTRKDGKKDTCKLDIKQDQVSGLIKNVDGKDTVKVDVEVYDKNNTLSYKGTDIVTKKSEFEYHTADGNLADVKKIERNDFTKLDSSATGMENLISEDILMKYIPLLADMYTIDSATLQTLIKQVISRKWTEQDLYLIESFIKLIIDAQESNIDYVVVNGDIIGFDPDGTITDPVVDNTDLCYEQTTQMIASVAKEYKISNDKLYMAVKENHPELFGMWPNSAKENAYLIILDEAKKILGYDTNDSSNVNDSTVSNDTTGITGCYTEAQLKEIAISEANAHNVSGEKLLGWLRENGFFKSQYNFGQKELVESWIKKGIMSISSTTVDSSNVDPVVVYLTTDEIMLMVQNMARENNVNGDELMSYLKLSTPLFREKWTTDHKDKVLFIIKDGIASLQNGSTTDTTVVAIVTTEEITAIANKMALNSNISAEKLISYLRTGTKLYTQSWSTAQYGEIEVIIKNVIATQFSNGTSTETKTGAGNSTIDANGTVTVKK